VVGEGVCVLSNPGGKKKVLLVKSSGLQSPDHFECKGEDCREDQPKKKRWALRDKDGKGWREAIAGRGKGIRR